MAIVSGKQLTSQKACPDIDVKNPRRCGRQTLRNNAPADTSDEYYKRNVTIPFLDHMVQQMNDRFSSTQQCAVKALVLVPDVIRETNPDAKMMAKELSESYKDDIPEPRTLDFELRMWLKKWHTWKEAIPTSPKDTLQFADRDFSPNIHTLLRLIRTLPVTSCENERTFSALRRLKHGQEV